MSASDIKTQYDRLISSLAADGKTVAEIRAATGKGLGFVRYRLVILGLAPKVAANLYRQRAERRAARLDQNGRRFGHCGSRAITSVPPARVDRSASDLARAVKADRAALAALDSTNLIACFHAAGLTLEDIEQRLGVAPIASVAAIRHAHQGTRL